MKKTKSPTPKAIARAKNVAQREFDRFLALPDSEKTREAEVAASITSRPLTRAEQAMLAKVGIGRRPGRPAKGEGAQQISVTVERNLLHRVDQFARLRGLSRAELIARGLEMVMQRRAKLIPASGMLTVLTWREGFS